MAYDWRSVPLPDRMRHLPKDEIGRPIPWFVHIDDDGVPDFRVVGPGKIADAIRFELCWTCGRRRGRHAAFLIGPMCSVNRVSAEPPSHLECVVYSARACPFMANPAMRRRPVTEEQHPGHVAPAGDMLLRNPGVGLVWSSQSWTVFDAPTPDGARGLLWDVGEPSAVSWWAEQRPATRAEVLASIDSGLPLLHDSAEAEGPAAVFELGRRVGEAMRFLPPPDDGVDAGVPADHDADREVPATTVHAAGPTADALAAGSGA